MNTAENGPEIEKLFAVFGKEHGSQRPNYVVIPGDEVPGSYHGLLVHNYHMTVTLEQFYHCRVNLRVLHSKQQGDHYARMILLVREGTDEILQFGIMQIDLRACDETVRTEIQAGGTPLGRILIEHNVLRHIEPYRFLRVIPNPLMMGWFGLSEPEAVYGRLGVIFCNKIPAVEVLEIVRPEGIV